MSGGKYENGTKRMSVAGIPFLQHKPVIIVDSEGNSLLEGGGGTSFEDLGYQPFSSAETYAVGDVVIYNNGLKKFTTAHEGAWDDDDVEPTSIEAEISAKIVDAPSDGKKYVRQHGAWSEMESATKVVEMADASSVELAPNVYTKITSIAEGNALAFTLGTAVSGFVNEYMVEFATGATAPTVTFPAAVKWAVDLQIEANKTYQVDIVNNIATYICA